MKKLSMLLVLALIATLIAVPAMAEGMTFSQSPLLDGQDLPPVEERLPEADDVMVVDKGTIIYEDYFTDYQIGKYGGTLKSVRNSATWDGWIWCILQERIIETVSGEGKDYYPNIIKGWEINDDYTEYTFFLRKGLKWSDGVPVTTEDTKWAFEMDHKNAQLTAAFPTFLKTNNNAANSPCELEIVDDYTFKLKFDDSYPGFLLQCTCQDYPYFLEPAHYLKDYHIDTADKDELTAKCEAEGFTLDDWYKLYELHDFSAWDSAAENQIGCPTLCAWMTTSKDGTTFTYTRNPYYFKVDTEGQQLPYADYLTSTYCVDQESIAVKILANEVDYTYEWVPLPDMGLYADNENYVMATKTLLHRTGADLMYNFTYGEPGCQWREVVNNYSFREAIHHAINAEEIIDTVYFGFADPADELSIIDYDPAKAEELLDSIGMTKGADGWRTYPDGSPCEIELTYSSWMVTYEPTATLISQDLQAVGLNIKMKYVDNDLMDTLRQANDLQMSIAFDHGPVYIQNTTDYNVYGMACNYYLNWLFNGEKGEERTGIWAEWYDVLYSVTRVPYEQAAEQHAKQKAFVKENLLAYYPCIEITQPSLVSKRLRNYPTEGGYNLDNCHASEVCWIDE